MNTQTTSCMRVRKYQVALEMVPVLFSVDLDKSDASLIKTYYEAVLSLGISFNETERTQLWPKLLLEQPHRFAQTKPWREQHAQFAPLLRNFMALIQQWAAGAITGQAILSALENQSDETQEYLSYFTDLAAPLLDPKTLEDYWLEAQLTAYASLSVHTKDIGLGLLLNDLSDLEGDALLNALPDDTRSHWLNKGQERWQEAIHRIERIAGTTVD